MHASTNPTVQLITMVATLAAGMIAAIRSPGVGASICMSTGQTDPGTYLPSWLVKKTVALVRQGSSTSSPPRTARQPGSVAATPIKPKQKLPTIAHGPRSRKEPTKADRSRSMAIAAPPRAIKRTAAAAARALRRSGRTTMDHSLPPGSADPFRLLPQLTYRNVGRQEATAARWTGHLRILAFGTYDTTTHPRSGILLDGLRLSGDEVVEANIPLGLTTAQRLELLAKPWLLYRLVIRLLWQWTGVLNRAGKARRTGPFDAIFVGYMGHFDVVLANEPDFPGTRFFWTCSSWPPILPATVNITPD